MQISFIQPPPLDFISPISSLFGFCAAQPPACNFDSTQAFPQQYNNCNWSPVALDLLACSSINTTAELPGCCPWCWSVNDGFVMEDASMLLSPPSHALVCTSEIHKNILKCNFLNGSHTPTSKLRLLAVTFWRNLTLELNELLFYPWSLSGFVVFCFIICLKEEEMLLRSVLPCYCFASAAQSGIVITKLRVFGHCEHFCSSIIYNLTPVQCGKNTARKKERCSKALHVSDAVSKGKSESHCISSLTKISIVLLTRQVCPLFLLISWSWRKLSSPVDHWYLQSAPPLSSLRFH